MFSSNTLITALSFVRDPHHRSSGARFSFCVYNKVYFTPKYAPLTAPICEVRFTYSDDSNPKSSILGAKGEVDCNSYNGSFKGKNTSGFKVKQGSSADVTIEFKGKKKVEKDSGDVSDEVDGLEEATWNYTCGPNLIGTDGLKPKVWTYTGLADILS